MYPINTATARNRPANVFRALFVPPTTQWVPAISRCFWAICPAPHYSVYRESNWAVGPSWSSNLRFERGVQHKQWRVNGGWDAIMWWNACSQGQVCDLAKRFLNIILMGSSDIKCMQSAYKIVFNVFKYLFSVFVYLYTCSSSNSGLAAK